MESTPKQQQQAVGAATVDPQHDLSRVQPADESHQREEVSLVEIKTPEPKQQSGLGLADQQLQEQCALKRDRAEGEKENVGSPSDERARKRRRVDPENTTAGPAATTTTAEEEEKSAPICITLPPLLLCLEPS